MAAPGQFLPSSFAAGGDGTCFDSGLAARRVAAAGAFAINQAI
jgi:hypothetical protein